MESIIDLSAIDGLGSKRRAEKKQNKLNLKCLCLAITALAFVGGLGIGFCFSVSPCNGQRVKTPRPASVPSEDVAREDLERVVSFVQHEELDDSTVDETRPSQSARVEPADDSIQSEAVRGIYWSDGVEKALPRGYDEADASGWRSYVKTSPIRAVEEGCGRMQNRLVTFKNGTKSCVRYRQNNDQIQGEIFTFYLSRLLGLKNLPPSSVGLVRPADDQWASVKSQLSQAQWAEERPVVMTKFLDNLQPAYIPKQFKNRQEASLNPLDFVKHRLDDDKERSELVELAQWSDLMVLDYLTANLDRMVNNMYNMQWNQAMMDSPAHNLARDPSGLLIFLDNESGLLHGYRLLDKYEPFHEELISSVCVFRRRTVEALEKLREKRSVEKRLKELYKENSDRKIVDVLPFLPEKSVKILNKRIDRVLDQASKCRGMYSSSSSSSSSRQLVTS